jgi:hypothetical protein
MTQTLTSRLGLIKNTPGTGEQVNIAEINSAFDEIDDNFVPAAKIINTNAAPQTVPNNAATQILYNATAFDSYSSRPEGPMADTTNDQIIIRKDGVYIVTCGGNFAANATGVRRLDVLKNGVTQGGDTAAGFTGAANGLSYSLSLSLFNGDLVTAKAFQNSGAGLVWDLNTFIEGNFLSAIWVGALL